MKRQYLGICMALALTLGGCIHNNPSESSPTLATTSVPPVTISIHAVDKTLNEAGTAKLESINDDTNTRVTITITNEPKGETQYAFFQYGTCTRLSSFVVFPLTDLVDGTSTTMYDVSLSVINNFGPIGPMDGIPGPGHSHLATPTPSTMPSRSSYAVTIWRYTTTAKTLVSCGEQKFGPF